MKDTKWLSAVSLLVVVVGFSLLWFGREEQVLTQPTPQIEATTSATLGIEGEKALVTEVIDGDTIEIENGSKIRLIGIDTPETKDPRRPVGCFGKEASNETKKLIEGKTIILQKDVSETDKYKRLLRYVFLPLDPSTSSGQLLFVNDYLIRAGFAKVLTYPPDVKYNEQFRQAEIEAREAKLGLWGRC